MGNIDNTFLGMTNMGYVFRSEVMETSALPPSYNQTFLNPRITKTGGSQHYFIGQRMGRFVIFYCQWTFLYNNDRPALIGQSYQHLLLIGEV